EQGICPPLMSRQRHRTEQRRLADDYAIQLAGNTFRLYSDSRTAAFHETENRREEKKAEQERREIPENASWSLPVAACVIDPIRIMVQADLSMMAKMAVAVVPIKDAERVGVEPSCKRVVPAA